MREIVFSHQHVRQIHGFYLTKETKNIRFDLVISFAAGDRKAAFQEVIKGMCSRRSRIMSCR